MSRRVFYDGSLNAVFVDGPLVALAQAAPATTVRTGYGTLYFSSGTKTWHQIDDTGLDTDLAAGGGGGAAVGPNTITLAVAGANGVAVTALRGDAVIAAFDATAPTTQAFGDAAVVGVINFAARRDHKHAMMAAPVQVSNSAVAGAADYVARIKVAADTTYRAFFGLDASDDGAIEFGSGGVAARDWSIRKQIAASGVFAAGTLAIDRLGAASATQIVGQSTAGQTNGFFWGVAGDSANRIVTRGDATTTGIEAGSGAAARDLRLYRSGAKTWTMDDTAAGAVTLNVVGTITQSGTAVSVTGHGASNHADITRNVFLGPEDGTLDAATFVSLGASPDLTRAVAYADAATQSAFWTFQVPDDWASGVITVQPVWSPGASDAVAHTVRWSFVAKTIPAASTVTAAGTTVTWTGASAARTVGVVVYDTATSTTLTPAAAGDLFRLEVRRVGADAADTYVGVVNLIGLIVSYTANQ